MGKITSVRLNEALAGQVDTLAAALDRPKSWVIEQAVQRYIEQEAWQVQAIKEAMDSYRSQKAAGHVVARPLDDVMRDLEAKIRAKLPAQ